MSRRSFLAWLTAGVNTLLAALLATPAAAYLLSPLRRPRRPASAGDRPDSPFVRLAPLSAIKDDKPIRLPIIAPRVDAYVTYPPQPVGEVWLLREDPARSDSPLRCFQVTCPHAGCAIDFAAERGAFACPCHASDFDRLGRRRTGPSPRDMDVLECRLSEPDTAGERWVEVKFERYETGTALKRVVL